MAKIEKEDGSIYFVPDDVVNDLTLTVLQVYESSMPWDEYKRYLRIKELVDIIDELTPSDEILLSWAKENHENMIQAKQYKSELERLENKQSE